MKRESVLVCNSIKTHGNKILRGKIFSEEENNESPRYVVSFYYKSDEMKILNFLLCLPV